MKKADIKDSRSPSPAENRRHNSSSYSRYSSSPSSDL